MVGTAQCAKGIEKKYKIIIDPPKTTTRKQKTLSTDYMRDMIDEMYLPRTGRVPTQNKGVTGTRPTASSSAFVKAGRLVRKSGPKSGCVGGGFGVRSGHRFPDPQDITGKFKLFYE